MIGRSVAIAIGINGNIGAVVVIVGIDNIGVVVVGVPRGTIGAPDVTMIGAINGT